MLQIVENIPAIHATIVGVAAAFFSAFFIYAYQKVTEAQKELDKALETAKDVSTLNSASLVGKTSLLDKNGNLDWKKCRRLIHEATTILSVLNITRSNTNSPTFHEKNDNQEVIRIVNELNHFFRLFFINYPMNVESIVSTSQSPLENLTHTFDSTRYSEIGDRITYLSWIWDTSQQSLIQLFDIYDQIIQQENQNKMQSEINKSISQLDRSLPNYQEVENRIRLQWQDIYNSFNQIRNTHLLMNFFERIQVYQTQVMPSLKETLNEFETFNDQFEIKKLTKYFLYTTIYIIVVGIIIPLILFQFMTNIGNDYNWIISFIEYFLLFASFAPYFIVLVYFLKKIENTIFK